ncbi:hypothetical protein SXCC_02513 [Gluconacetobacter sp. SXCC-1]|uniref:2-keto-D-gluconate dehydrogenase n=1 Tax=Komagataeibacter rhaeticus TaxID=215221 RepID=A0A181CAF0_9PROT|nr:McrC family protein [Komagataeibacter rhaeticus]ATU72942.1 2-keto-D-gluconate dehydrogenase [Komagataeibacter xylinus]EGG77301.1 hypothetical protein SXCC_02513 [Gluconacetobacter sp. SXCC-1]QIP35309.1 2-keto-D-gluconate dehydrogenase [Komagataeibacter rhaeticus]QOC47873.1 McrC family protein [Komagataeibacter rhaeticus]WPP22746.1 McrC family protein [Komagataeibacter rhaeticus]
MTRDTPDPSGNPFYEYEIVTLDRCRATYDDDQATMVFEWLKHEGRAGGRALPRQHDTRSDPWVGTPFQHRMMVDGRWQVVDAVRFSSWVGVVRTPCGAQIEILPKTGNDRGADRKAAPASTRRQFIQMLACLPEMQHIRHPLRALVDTQMDMPLGDIFLSAFLHSVAGLLGRGMRRDYVRHEDNLPTLRGRLCMAAQMRHNLVRRDRFYTRHDEFSANRAENRLIHTALLRVLEMAGTDANHSLTRRLLVAFDGVPLSTDIARDMELVRHERDMHYYHEALSWTVFILNDLFPLTARTRKNTDTQHEAAFMLFPMECVFEKAVAVALATQMPQGYRLEEQFTSRHLVTCLPKAGQEPEQRFSLRPDMVVLRPDSRTVCMVLDTKWKRPVPDASVPLAFRDSWINQSDLYQMKAYGDNYLNEGNGPVVLVYPRTNNFITASQPFIFNSADGTVADMEDRLQLWLVPFCLDRHILVLPDADGKAEKDMPPAENASRPLDFGQFITDTPARRYQLGLDMGRAD